MRILIVVTDFDMGGITTSLMNLLDELIHWGHRVDIMNLPGNTSFPVQFNKEVHIIPLTGKARYWNVGLPDLQKATGAKKFVLLIVGIFKKVLSKFGLWEKFIFSGTPKMECAVAIAYRQSAICYYLIKHKTTAERTLAFIHSEFDGDCRSWLPHLKEIDSIVCVSNAWSNLFRQKFPYLENKVATVYNLFAPEELREKANTFIPEYDKSRFTLVTTARIEFCQKKLDTIPTICQALRLQTKREFCWYIVGDGPDRSMLEQIIRETNTGDCVKLLGAQKNPYPYMKNADLFVLTSIWESYGMVITESLILGTPVVAGEYPALKEIIEDGVTGIIAQNSAEGICKAIAEVMNDTGYYQRLKKNCMAYEYNSDIAYKQFVSLLGGENAEI